MKPWRQWQRKPKGKRSWSNSSTHTPPFSHGLLASQGKYSQFEPWVGHQKEKNKETFEDDPAKILGILKSEPIYHAFFKTNTHREKSLNRSTNQQKHKTGSLDKGSTRVGRNCVNSDLSLYRYLSFEVIHCESRRFFKESYKKQSQIILAVITITSKSGRRRWCVSKLWFWFFAPFLVSEYKILIKKKLAFGRLVTRILRRFCLWNETITKFWPAVMFNTDLKLWSQTCGGEVIHGNADWTISALYSESSSEFFLQLKMPELLYAW